MNRKYFDIINIIRKNKNDNEILECLSNYHENDIADIIAQLTADERKRIYGLLGFQRMAEIFVYLDEPERYLEEISIEDAAKIISFMDSDDAVEILEKLDTDTKNEIEKRLDDDAAADVKMLLSYDEDEIGRYMTTNYVCIKKGLSVRQAMSELVRQAGENDNIMTIYVEDELSRFAGAIDLKDLITARENDNLEEIVINSYPYVTDHELLDECIEQIVDYSEDSIPVLSKEKQLLGVITSEDIVDIVDDEMGEDYAKLAGLTAEEDLKETTVQSMKKRLPWLIILLFLGVLVSSVVGMFENVVAVLPIVICFQSLVLDMAGNVGTQSLAVTIRVLTDGSLTAKQKLHLVSKEMRVGLLNGTLIGVLSFIAVGLYIFFFKGKGLVYSFAMSGCIGISLILAIIVSSAVGTLTPLFFKKIKIDPAVASGPMITTLNDLVAVVAYYGTSWIFLLNVLKLG